MLTSEYENSRVTHANQTKQSNSSVEVNVTSVHSRVKVGGVAVLLDLVIRVTEF